MRVARAVTPHHSAVRVGPDGTVLALDFGARRVGVAVGDLKLGIAHPLETLVADSDRARMEQIARLVREWAPALVVVGLPMHMDGREHTLSARCRRFAARVEQQFGIATRLVDERLTSVAAAASLGERGVRGRRQKLLLDQMAAVHILQTFFGERDVTA